jgi:hypothetical protein
MSELKVFESKRHTSTFPTFCTDGMLYWWIGFFEESNWVKMFVQTKNTFQNVPIANFQALVFYLLHQNLDTIPL